MRIYRLRCNADGIIQKKNEQKQTLEKENIFLFLKRNIFWEDREILQHHRYGEVYSALKQYLSPTGFFHFCFLVILKGESSLLFNHLFQKWKKKTRETNKQ